MAIKRRTRAGSSVEVRSNVKKALLCVEQAQLSLIDALCIVEGNAVADLAEAVKALRAIANSHGHVAAEQMRGVARATLARIRVKERAKK